MELGMLIMPYCVKITYEIDENDDWLEGLDTINDFFMDKDIYPTGPIVFQRKSIGLGEFKYTAYISLNNELQDIPELNIEYIDVLEVGPTLSEKCFDEEEFEQVYRQIETAAKDNDISIKDEPYYHVMVDYFGGTAFEIYAQLEVNDGEVNE
ncbi:DUF5085 family protein [Staphylococcus caprae]|uniref:DUF5085 domain-containing protein n=1 Tax=Staphylococcus caprae TaxID=29380 RepID=A0ABM7FY80_9STAP|nr:MULTISPECIES: DUF5085 family protein [Staphylococcus]MBN6825032.1 DUF5085 family protein [Staphylococcus caprae]MBX5317703.1 DUF5085 family protein [Staphylococcus caprae]MBX5322306.1 DUF5085 family protein [Staphylococcus caprae]MDI0015146.1 DUF5085 family protein [Staphylococcus caprae]MEB8093875.1 DUF5085 family protein [Staphylococcus caprae]